MFNWLSGWGRCHGGARTGSPSTTLIFPFGYKFPGAFQYRKRRPHFSDTTPIPPSLSLGYRKIKLTSISAETEPCELFCAVVHYSSFTVLTDALWMDHIQKPATDHL